MLQRHHQHNIKAEIQGHGHHADLDRGRGVAAREEAGGQHLDQHERRQPHAIGRQGLRRQPRAFRIESAPSEQRPHNRESRNNQRQGGRQSQHQRILDRPVQGGGGGLGFAAAHLTRQQRQQGGADGRADDPQRQLLDAVGIIQQRHRAGGQQTGDDDVHREVELSHPRPHQPRRHAFQQQPHPGCEARPWNFEAHAGTPSRPD